MGTRISRASREPWTVERTLHMLLAAIAVIGWVVAYTALVKGGGSIEDIARSERAATKVSSNLAPPASQVSPSVSAVR
jgi:hypothetical protein